MKILFTMTPAFNPSKGGVQRTTYKLGKYFYEHGFEVFYFSFEKEGHIESEFGTLYTANFESRNKNPKNVGLMIDVVERVSPDIVINQMPYEAELRDNLFDLQKSHGFLLLGCLRNSLYSFKSNARHRMKQMLPAFAFRLLDNRLGMSFIQWRHKMRHSSDLRKIIDKNDFFILLSPPNRTELEYFVGKYKSEKIISIPNSIPSIQSKLGEKQKIILHVGRLDIPQKRSDLLIPFWKSIHTLIPEWSFVIVGEGPYMEMLKHEIKESKLPRIKLEGHQKPERYYAEASIFIMPSAFEGFPNTIIEAQSFGCVPVVFNSYAALEWIVNHNQDALLIPPFDTFQMAQHVKNLVDDSSKLFEMQQSSLTNASRFTIDTVGKMWVDFFTTQTQ